MTWTPETILGAPYHRSAAAVAVGVANTGPCAKSKRGAVVVTSNHQAVFRAHNGPPAGVSCTAGDTCRATCRARAVHAEARAIQLAGHQARGSELVHVKVVDGHLVTSGRPSCGQCSKTAMDAGVAGVWLYHAFEDGPRWQRYETALFHALSLVGEEERAAEAKAKADERILVAMERIEHGAAAESKYLRHLAGCAEGESLHDAIVRSGGAAMSGCWIKQARSEWLREYVQAHPDKAMYRVAEAAKHHRGWTPSMDSIRAARAAVGLPVKPKITRNAAMIVTPKRARSVQKDRAARARGQGPSWRLRLIRERAIALYGHDPELRP